MKNAKLIIHIACIVLAVQIVCMVKLTAQNVLNWYSYLGIRGTHYYFISNCSATWDEANEAAMEMGGHLASIGSNDLNNWLSERVASYPVDDDELPGAWIGLRGQDGVFEWSNGEPITYEPYWFDSPQEPVYTDGAALIGAGYASPSPYYWITGPVTGESEYVVQFSYQPNCDNNPNKTYVCHNGNTICVNITALQSHLDHGDLEGPCGPCNIPAMRALPDETTETEGYYHQAIGDWDRASIEEIDRAQKIPSSDRINIFPNPASAEIHVILPEGNQEGTLRILSLTGQVIFSQSLRKEHTFGIDLSGYSTGMYLMDVQSPNNHYQLKFIKL